MKKYIAFLFTLLIFSFSSIQQNPDPRSDYFNKVRKEYNGDIAYQTTAYVEQFWRVAGNAGFDSSIYFVAARLERAGYVKEEKASPTDKLTYRIEKRPLRNPAWEPVDASITISGENEPLLQFSTNRNMIAMNSFSTPEEGVEGEVIKIENSDQLKNVSLKGKIVFADMSPGALFEKAVSEGALGVITYSNPGYLKPEKNKTSIQFRGIPYKENLKAWGIAMSFEAREKLNSALAKGPTKLKVKIKTKIYPSEELTLVAEARGEKTPDERLVFSAHVQEPGANDNASGVGVQLEMATVTAQLLKKGEIKLNRTLTFLWGDEIVSTRRYITENKERASKIKWGISLDMVGENTAITGGSFLIEKMPDPSAIWTRGDDKHSEWGAGDVSLDDMKPHYLNDFIINTMKQQGEFANWTVNTNPFEGGSDHTPFIDANIPGLLMWHFTDQFYHTDNDRIDKVSKETLRNVGTGALVSAFTLINADLKTAQLILSQVKKEANERIQKEFELSKQAIAKGNERKEETKILEAWKDWYLKALQSINDLGIANGKDQFEKELNRAKQDFEKLASELITKMK